MYTEQLSQALSFAGAEIDPASADVGTVTTGGVDMAKFHRSLFVLLIGTVGDAGSVSAKLQQSANGSSSWTDVSGSSITLVTASNKVVTLEIRADQLGFAQRFVRLAVTIGGNAVQIAALALGGEAVQKPGSVNDVASVAQRLVM